MGNNAHSVEARRKAIEDDIRAHNERSVVLAQEFRQVVAEEERNKSKMPHIQRINTLLETARQALEEAGMIGEEHGIDFVFQSPRGEIDFRVDWMSSDCYGDARWYEQGYQV